MYWNNVSILAGWILCRTSNKAGAYIQSWVIQQVSSVPTMYQLLEATAGLSLSQPNKSCMGYSQQGQYPRAHCHVLTGHLMATASWHCPPWSFQGTLGKSKDLGGWWDGTEAPLRAFSLKKICPARKGRRNNGGLHLLNTESNPGLGKGMPHKEKKAVVDSHPSEYLWEVLSSQSRPETPTSDNFKVQESTPDKSCPKVWVKIPGR